MSTNPKSLVVAFLAVALAACGGSSKSGGTPGTPQTPNLFLQGTITAKVAGQIEVNGVKVSTTAATTKVEGIEKPESSLKTGMVVKVKAHRSTAGSHEAEGVEVEFHDSVQGKVAGKDDAASTIVVGGQLVRVDDSTEFEDDGRRLGSIAEGERVSVSGVADDKGGLRATRVEKIAGVSDDFEVKGIVSDLTAAGFTLKLSPDAVAADTFTVNLLGGATIPAGLANGGLAEVRSTKPVQTGNVIEASSITLEDRLPGQVGGETEVEGIVTSGTSDQFVVNGTTVATSAGTTWIGGVPADLLPGVKVEAEGVLGADGVLSAHKVSFKASARVYGRVSGRAGAGTDTTFSVNGVPVRGEGPLLTDWRTSGDAIVDGDWIEIRGAADRSGLTIVATRVEVKSAGNARPVLQGVVTAADATAGTVTILGKTVAVAGEIRGISGVSGVDGPLIDKAAFLAAVTPGVSIAKATGTNDADWSTGPTSALKGIELEGDR